MASPKVDLTAPYKQRVKKALDDSNLRAAIRQPTQRFSEARFNAMGAVDGQTLRAQTRQMKEFVLRNLPQLLEEFEAKVTENGGHVHWARDGVEANEIICQIARRNGVAKVVKSKSMATEEIHLNSALQQEGIRVLETDLGEYIIQLDDEPPSHIVAPIIHKRIEDISAIFQRELDMPPSYDPIAMCSVAREELRKEFLGADMGVSGCNFGIAETGTVCIVTNEGNGRMTTSLPPVYVALMGIEKLVPTVEDALLQYQALCRSATGQQVSVYLSMTSAPAGAQAVDGPTQFHVILLDNGRADMLARGYGEALMCIRCGACLNVCPVYRQIGGHAYGSTYSGPIGAVISPILHNKVTNVEQLPHASSLCGACRDACPVQIDLPRLLLDLRDEQVQHGQSTLTDRMAMKGFVHLMQSRTRYERAGRLAQHGSSLLRGLSDGAIKRLPPPFSAWTRSRDFPPFAKKSFRTLWRERGQTRTKG